MQNYQFFLFDKNGDFIVFDLCARTQAEATAFVNGEMKYNTVFKGARIAAIFKARRVRVGTLPEGVTSDATAPYALT